MKNLLLGFTLGLTLFHPAISKAQALEGGSHTITELFAHPTLSEGCSGSTELNASEAENGLISVRSVLDPLSLAQNSALVRSACALVIPMQIPAGKELIIQNLSAVAEALPASHAQVHAEVFFAGQQGLVLGNKQDTFVTSGCGKAVNFRLNASQAATGSLHGTSVKLDTLTVKATLQDCK